MERLQEMERGKRKTGTTTSESTSAGVVVKLREMPLGHAIRRANLAALLLADAEAKKESEDGTQTARRWHIAELGAG